MKSKLFLIAVVILGLTSWKEITTVNIDTTLIKTPEAAVDDNVALIGKNSKSTKAEGFNFMKLFQQKLIIK